LILRPDLSSPNNNKFKYIPNLKSSFGSVDWHIPIVLRTIGQKRIRRIEKVNRELPSAFLTFLKQNGVDAKIRNWKTLDYEGQTYEKRKANKKYLITQIYGLALPTCIQFDLVSQQDQYEMLTFFGRKLLKIINEEHVSRISQSKNALDLFKRIVVERDIRLWEILSTIQEIGKEADIDKLTQSLLRKGVKIEVSTKAVQRIAREKILNDLKKKGVIRNWTDNLRLSSWIESKSKQEIKRTIMDNQKAIVRSLLSVFVSLGLIQKEIAKYHINQDEVGRVLNLAFWNEANLISNSRFFELLKSSWLKFAKLSGKLVSIPIIRDEVCLRLDIPWYVFDKKIIEIGYMYGGYRISLSRAIFSKKWGIFIGKTNYYYISIVQEGY